MKLISKIIKNELEHKTQKDMINNVWEWRQFISNEELKSSKKI